MIITGQLLVFRAMECPHKTGCGRSSLHRAIIWLRMNLSGFTSIAPYVNLRFPLLKSRQNFLPAHQLRHRRARKTILLYQVAVVTIMRVYMNVRTAKKMAKTIMSTVTVMSYITCMMECLKIIGFLNPLTKIISI